LVQPSTRDFGVSVKMRCVSTRQRILANNTWGCCERVGQAYLANIPVKIIPTNPPMP
jgi:hypothetical protein